MPAAPHAPPRFKPLAWDFAALTHTGRVRPHNEDAVAFEPQLGLALLADGLGGYSGGEVASRMAVEQLQSQLGPWLSQAGATVPARDMRQAMQAGVDVANRAIYDASSADARLRGMGTTLVMAAFGRRQVVTGHIGDSRCYRLRGTELRQLTRDHSVRQIQLDSGVLDPQKAATWPHRNLITRAMGVEQQVELEVRSHTARPGDIFLLCSDGLSDMLDDAEIRRLLFKNTGITEKATLLIESANEQGGKDNISVVLAQAR